MLPQRLLDSSFQYYYENLFDPFLNLGPWKWDKIHLYQYSFSKKKSCIKNYHKVKTSTWKNQIKTRKWDKSFRLYSNLDLVLEDQICRWSSFQVRNIRNYIRKYIIPCTATVSTVFLMKKMFKKKTSSLKTLGTVTRTASRDSYNYNSSKNLEWQNF